jgi:ribosomal protein S18 acetylase RimI-like enzyme
VTTRWLELKDLNAVMRLEKLCFKPPFAWELQNYADEFSNGMEGFAHEEKEKISGIILWNKRANTRNGLELISLQVDPEKRNKGIAQELLNELLIETDERLFLEVYTKNIPAIKFYEKNGFKKSRTQKNYYKKGYDAYTYVLSKEKQ